MLPDVLAPGLRLVFCGSAAGTKSAELKAYYAGPGNRFWQTIAALGLTPRELAPGEFHILPNFGIGLTDLAKGQAGSDAVIRFGPVDRARLEKAILWCQPRVLCFNGKRAAKEYFGARSVQYGIQARRLGTTDLFVAPSTSGAARKFWDFSVWRTLAELVRAPAA